MDTTPRIPFSILPVSGERGVGRMSRGTVTPVPAPTTLGEPSRGPYRSVMTTASAAHDNQLSRRDRALVAPRRYAAGLSLAGLFAALVFYCLSLTPSLIPRAWFYQAAISALSLVSGYGVGVGLVRLGRALGFGLRPGPVGIRRARVTLGALAVVLVPTFLALGARWQDAIRTMMGAAPGGPWHPVTQAVVALVLAVAVLQGARGLRWAARRLARLLGRWVPVPFARLVAVVAVAVLAVLTFNGTILAATLDTLSTIYADVDKGTREGVVRPTQPERSGSPASLAGWDSLGAQGRTFVAGGPTLDEIQGFVDGRPGAGVTAAVEPIRVYAGLHPTGDLEASAAQVVAELDRTDAWSRDVLVVATSTGTGWIDPSFADTLELMHGGRTAIASMQYSYLPSWVAFVGDRSTPEAAGVALFEAVYRAWDARPEPHRPQLVAYGLSLGSYGSQAAFSGAQDMITRTQGALWVGTPGFTENWRLLTDRRDAGSPEITPVLDGGRHLRWSSLPGSAADLAHPAGEWSTPRIVYLQHPSDAITWWSPDLALERPDWLAEPRGAGVSPETAWIPVVTFLQLTMDLFVAGEVPQGYGHSYHLEYSDALAAVAPPQGWTAADTARLVDAVRDRPTES